MGPPALSGCEPALKARQFHGTLFPFGAASELKVHHARTRYWQGRIRLALVSIPLKVYPATRSGAAISFQQIHEPSGKQARYEKVVPRRARALGVMLFDRASPRFEHCHRRLACGRGTGALLWLLQNAAFSDHSCQSAKMDWPHRAALCHGHYSKKGYGELKPGPCRGR